MTGMWSRIDHLWQDLTTKGANPVCAKTGTLGTLELINHRFGPIESISYWSRMVR
jgi:hypothetical protein